MEEVGSEVWRTHHEAAWRPSLKKTQARLRMLENRATEEGLAATLLERNRRLTQRSVVVKLTELREFAVKHLQNRNVGSDEALEALKTDIDAWQATILGALLEVDAPASEVSYFRILGTWTRRNLPSWSPEHAKEREMVAERIDRLLKIVRRLESARPTQ